MTTLTLHGIPGLVEVARFEPDGNPFGAENRAEDWLRDHGFAAGSPQRDSPRAILPTHLYSGVAKWRNLTEAERRQCWGLWIVDGGAQVLYLRPTVLALSSRERDQRLAAAIRKLDPRDDPHSHPWEMQGDRHADEPGCWLCGKPESEHLTTTGRQPPYVVRPVGEAGT